ncbi:sulfotransferase [Bradyrhizobium sp. 8-10B]|uniref:sulfotransferase family protein n=1 Tax=Bradyrhizobium sp. 8-10B TaxID=3344579 RepID=UPI0035C06041
MRGLFLGWQGVDAAAARDAWRAASALACPSVPGLLARQWQLDRSELGGLYLFDRPEQVEAFLVDLSVDQAFSLLSSAVGARARPIRPVHHELRSTGIDRPILIIAAPRSGSTLLFDLLSQAPGLWTQGIEGQGAVEGIASLHPEQRGYHSHRLTDEDHSDAVGACLNAGFRFGLRDRDGRPYDVRDDRQPAPRLLDKTTENTLRVSFLARAWPDARFIFLYRDARQNVSSLMEAWNHGGFVKIRDLTGWPRGDWCFLLPPGWRQLCGQSLQRVVAAQWEAANRLAMDDFEQIDRCRWTSVDYNELITTPKRVVLRLCAHLRIETDARLLARLDRPLPVSPTAISPPSATKWRYNRDLDAAALELQVRSVNARLRSLDLPERPSAASSLWRRSPPADVRFSCFLDELGAVDDDVDQDNVVDPSFRYQLGSSIPIGMATATRFRDRFLGDHPIMWVRAPLTGMYTPFWVRRGEALHYVCLQAGRPVPSLESARLARLRSAGIAGSPAARLAICERAAVSIAMLSGRFNAAGYCVVPSILGPAHTCALAGYYRRLVDSRSWELGDDQVARRHGWHNEAMARFIHHQLAAFVSAIVGQRACPSYAYVSAYQSGAELDAHVDRKQCEYTLSLVIDEQGGLASSWPLHLLTDLGRQSVTLKVGDGVLFRGHDLPHWREPAPEPRLALNTLLLHYVPDGFAETLN